MTWWYAHEYPFCFISSLLLIALSCLCFWARALLMSFFLTIHQPCRFRKKNLVDMFSLPQGLPIMLSLRRADELSGSRDGQRRLSSAQHDGRLNQEPADRVAIARLLLARRVVEQRVDPLETRNSFFTAFLLGRAAF